MRLILQTELRPTYSDSKRRRSIGTTTTVLSLSNRLMAMILFLNPLLLPAGVGKCFNAICLNLEEEKKKNADWNDFSFRLPKFEIL